MNPFDTLVCLGLLVLAGIFTLILIRFQSDQQNRRILDRSKPEFPSLTPHFLELQGRISSEAEEIRRQATNYAGNTQTAIRILADQVKKRPSADTMYSLIEAQGESIVEVLAKEIQADGKKTRERVAQVKTRLADEESDDQEAKRRARADGNSVYLSTSTTGLVIGPDDTEIQDGDGNILGYIVRDSVVTGEVKDKRKTKARRAASTSKKPKASK